MARCGIAACGPAVGESRRVRRVQASQNQAVGTETHEKRRRKAAKHGDRAPSTPPLLPASPQTCVTRRSGSRKRAQQVSSCFAPCQRGTARHGGQASSGPAGGPQSGTQRRCRKPFVGLGEGQIVLHQSQRVSARECGVEDEETKWKQNGAYITCVSNALSVDRHGCSYHKQTETLTHNLRCYRTPLFSQMRCSSLTTPPGCLAESCPGGWRCSGGAGLRRSRHHRPRRNCCAWWSSGLMERCDSPPHLHGVLPHLELAESHQRTCRVEAAC